MPEQPKPRRLGPFLIVRSPRPSRERGEYFHVKVAALTGLALIVLHDGVYRQTQPKGEGDFELWGTISHAGLDMLAVVAFTVIALVLVEHGRIK